MKNIYLTILSTALCLSVYGQWDGVSTNAVTPIGHTYTVSTENELAWVSEQSKTNSFAGDTISLSGYLDMGGYEWHPIGDENVKFEGVFIGNNYVIQNLQPNVTALQPQDAGLFGYIGEDGEVRNVGLAQGYIFLKDKQYLGSIAGRNEGTISHCINLMRITGEGCDYVGGLVGYNSGTIEYCVNMGVIAQARNYVGGMVGCNDGTIKDSYAAGFISATGMSGAIMGCMGTGAIFSDVYYDQQMTLQNAMGNQNIDGIIAVATTEDFRSTGEGAQYFNDNDEWQTSTYSYPRLVCFNLSTESFKFLEACVSQASLGTEKPLMYAYSVNDDFKVEKGNRSDGIGGVNNWTTDVTDGSIIIDIDKGGDNVEVNRPCTSKPVYLTSEVGGYEKEVCVMLEGFRTFQAGSISNNKNQPYLLCEGTGFELKTMENSAPEYGKDDELDNPNSDKYAPYYYKTEVYDIYDENEDGVMDTVLIDVIEKTTADYDKAVLWFNNFSDDKLIMFRRYTHDSQCQTDYARNDGEFYLEFLSDFNAGAIDEENDTIYGNLPQSIKITEIAGASGGKEDYQYRWWENGRLKSDELGIPLSDAECEVMFSQPGVYKIRREAHDSYCMTDFIYSAGEKTIVVYEDLDGGEIPTEQINNCGRTIEKTIIETEAATGGMGKYMYKWLQDGEDIEGKTDAALDMSDMSFDAGKTYVISRQVKDSSSRSEWVTTRGEITLVIYKEFDFGQIESDSVVRCTLSRDEAEYDIEINEKRKANADGEIDYRWVMSQVRSDGSEQVIKIYGSNESTIDKFATKIKLEDWPGIQMPATFIFRREVQNTLCSMNWEVSDGKVKIIFGLEDNRTDTIYPCPQDLPYSYEFTREDGSKETYVFTKDDETHIFTDKSIVGCEKTLSVNCKIYDYPIVKIPSLGALCQDKPEITIPIDIVQGRPDHYKVFFSEELKNLGLEDFSHSLENSDEIEIEIGAVPMEEHWMGIQFYEAGVVGTCPTPVDTVRFTLSLAGYVHQKWNDCLYVDNNDKNGWPNADTDLKFTSFEWYKDGERIEGATDQLYYEEGGLNGIYYVLLTDMDGNVYRSCDYEARPNTGLNDIRADIENGNAEVITLAGQRLDRMPSETGIYIIKYSTYVQKIYIR